MKANTPARIASSRTPVRASPIARIPPWLRAAACAYCRATVSSDSVMTAPTVYMCG